MKRSRLSPRSDKTAERDALYADARDRFLFRRRRCEIGWDGGCTGWAHEVHHTKGRVGDLMLDETHWLAACRHCHHQATVNPAEAFDRGVSLHRNWLEGS